MKTLQETKDEVNLLIDGYINNVINLELNPNTGLKTTACVSKLERFKDSVCKSNNKFAVNTIRARASFYYKGIKKHGS